MKNENKAFLDANRHHYNLLVNAGIVKHLDGATREGLLRIIREEFAPNYIASTWCQSCVADILKFAYVQYDKWIAAQPKEEPVIEEDFIPAMTGHIPTVAEPDGAILKTTFPKNDQHKKKRRKK